MSASEKRRAASGVMSLRSSARSRPRTAVAGEAVLDHQIFRDFSCACFVAAAAGVNCRTCQCTGLGFGEFGKVGDAVQGHQFQPDQGKAEVTVRTKDQHLKVFLGDGARDSFQGKDRFSSETAPGTPSRARMFWRWVRIRFRSMGRK